MQNAYAPGRVSRRNKQVKPAGLRRGPLNDDEVVLSGNESQTSPRSVDLIHAVDELNDTLPADIGLVVEVIAFCDSDGVNTTGKLLQNHQKQAVTPTESIRTRRVPRPHIGS